MNTTPQCIGVIVDGNRRWAHDNSLPKLEGHRKGYNRLEECMEWVKARKIPHLVAYMFSTENWNRTEEEVSYLMTMFEDILERRLNEVTEKGTRIRFLGTRDRFSPHLRELMERIEEKSAVHTEFTFWACISYGGRLEITEAAQSLAASNTDITEESLRRAMWSAEMPDPDIIIRTSGEQRLSNFLLWQASYSELFFLKQHWPDFTEADLNAVLEEYTTRQRRRGK